MNLNGASESAEAKRMSYRSGQDQERVCEEERRSIRNQINRLQFRAPIPAGGHGVTRRGFLEQACSPDEARGLESEAVETAKGAKLAAPSVVFIASTYYVVGAVRRF